MTVHDFNCQNTLSDEDEGSLELDLKGLGCKKKRYVKGFFPLFPGGMAKK